MEEVYGAVVQTAEDYKERDDIINMELRETKEINLLPNSDIGNRTKAFENYDIEEHNDIGVRNSDNLGGWPDLPSETTFDEALKNTNPNYDISDPEGPWNVNCQRCVPAFEMRCRGYDVVARPRPDVYADELAYFPFNAWESPDIIECSINDRSEIEKQMQEWGDGARAQIVVKWEGGAGGHTFTAIQENGITRFVDPQAGLVDASSHFDFIEAGTTCFCRIDNLQPTSKILDCCTSVGG